jgi:hypothetical protein
MRRLIENLVPAVLLSVGLIPRSLLRLGRGKTTARSPVAPEREALERGRPRPRGVWSNARSLLPGSSLSVSKLPTDPDFDYIRMGWSDWFFRSL